MKKHITTLIFLVLSFGTIAQNAFDNRLVKPKKPYKGTPVGNAETISGKHLNSPGINGDFPLSLSLNKQFKNFAIEWDETGQYAISITPKSTLHIETDIRTLSGNPLLAGVLAHLNTIKKLIQLENPEAELFLTSSQTDEIGFTHLKFRQHLGGITVSGGEIIVHIKNTAIESITNHLYPTPVLSPVKFIETQSVLDLILKEIPFEKLDELGSNLLSKRISSEKVIYHLDKNPKNETYCYRIEYRPNLLDWWEFIVEGSTGKLLSKVNKTCSIDGPRTASATDLNSVSRTINTYLVGSTYYLLDAGRPMFNSALSTMPNNAVGAIWTLDANFSSGTSLYNNTSSNNSWTNRTAVSAHYNSSVAYEYYRTVHNRNSINGTGGNVTSIINVNNQNGTKMDNAYWNGEMMFYGNGNTAFTPLAGSLDVAGHEMTHGVVQNTANLEYQGQSGAINESMADVFGSLMDRDDWKIGDDVTKTSYIPSGALRDLSDPHNGRTSLSQAGYQPRQMSEYYTGTSDNGGVHINSGIPNYAYYLIANSTGKNSAEKIYYRALTVYLTSQSQFIDLRKAVIKSAEDLFGNGSAEASAAINAFNTVGIYGYNGTGGGGGPGNGNGEVILSVNPGTESIISFDTDLSTASTLYTSNTSGGGFVAKSQTDIKRKCSVTDDGTKAYFVSAADDRIKSINLTGSTNETYVSAIGDAFDNVAISKNGKRLAAITTEIDSSIYVYDFTLQQWKQFKLYNPTFSDGINSGGVLYADGIEWDYSGQYIVYDAKNIIEGTFGSDITWWDIGTIKVWDNAGNTWGDGTIKKLFNQLNENINIGNPSFAKNTGNIIAFDVIDLSDDTYYIYGKNTVTGKTDQITTATQIGFPGYSNKDDKLIYDATNTSGTKVLAVINLGTDKITASGSPSVLISDAKWGTWYAQGTRSLLSSAKDILSFSFPYLSPSPSANFNGTTISVDVPSGTDVTNMYPTFVLSAKASAFVTGIGQISGVSRKNFTSPVTYTVMAENGSTKNYTVLVNLVSGVLQTELNQVTVYPNPANERISVSEPFHTYVISDITGKKLLSGSENEIDISALNHGIYTIAIQLNTGLNINCKLIKN